MEMVNIDIEYNPEYEEEAEKENLGKRFRTKPLDEAVRAILKHEINHKAYKGLKGCPRNIKLHASKVLQGIAKGMKKKGFENTIIDFITGQTLYGYMANIFEDWIDDVENEYLGRFTGQWFFYHDVGNHTPNQKYNPLYEAFVKLQLDTADVDGFLRDLVEEHFTYDEKVAKVLDRFYKRSGLAKRKKKIRFNGGVMIQNDYDAILTYITNERKWYNLARVFAEEFSELIETPVMPSFFIPLMGNNEFEKQMNDDETRMKLAWDEYMDGDHSDDEELDGEEIEEEVEEEDGNNKFTPPAYMDNYEALNYVYEKLARDLEFKTKAHTTSEKMAVLHTGRKDYNPREDRHKRIKARVDEQGNIKPVVGRDPFEIDIVYHETPEGLPEIKVAFMDVSDSTRHGIGCGYFGCGNSCMGKIMNPWASEDNQWGDKSIYHKELEAFYGLLDTCKKHGALKSSNVKAGVFSSGTRWGNNLLDAKRTALTPEFHGTTIHKQDVDELFSGSGNLIIMMSDGEISSWGERYDKNYTIGEKFIEMAKKHHFAYLQFGGANSVSGHMEEEGLYVQYDTGENAAKLVFDFVNPVLARYKTK